MFTHEFKSLQSVVLGFKVVNFIVLRWEFQSSTSLFCGLHATYFRCVIMIQCDFVVMQLLFVVMMSSDRDSVWATKSSKEVKMILNESVVNCFSLL